MYSDLSSEGEGNQNNFKELSLKRKIRDIIFDTPPPKAFI
jgi:hypothetical protein